MAQIRKKGMLNLRDIFLKTDPMVKEGANIPMGNPQNTFLSMHSGGDARGIMIDSGMDFGSKKCFIHLFRETRRFEVSHEWYLSHRKVEHGELHSLSRRYRLDFKAV